MDQSSKRMEDRSSLFTAIDWDQWVDLPDAFLIRFPFMREWDIRRRSRDEANRAKIELELSKLQKSIAELAERIDT